MTETNSTIKDSQVRNLQMAVVSVGKGSQPEEARVAEIKMQTQDLDFFYGKFKALGENQPFYPGQTNYRHHWPFGLR